MILTWEFDDKACYSYHGIRTCTLIYGEKKNQRLAHGKTNDYSYVACIFCPKKKKVKNGLIWGRAF